MVIEDAMNATQPQQINESNPDGQPPEGTVIGAMSMVFAEEPIPQDIVEQEPNSVGDSQHHGGNQTNSSSTR